MPKQSRSYGTWPSPVSPQMLAAGLRLNDVQWDSDGETLVWLERRGPQGVLVMRRGDDALCDLTSDLSVRAQVGYGGGDFTVAQGMVYFAGPGGRLYRQALAGGLAKPVTPAYGAVAAPSVSADGKWLVYVHSYEGADCLALVDAGGEAWPARLAHGTDFVMQPVWHPQGKYMAYVAWDQPLMPWDGTQLHLMHLDYEQGVPGVVNTEIIAGDEATAIFQPAFSSDGRYLAYVSDAEGWGQLYLYDLENKTHRRLTDDAAEHSTPAWAQGMRTYGWAFDSKSLFYLQNSKALITLWRYDLQHKQAVPVEALAGYTHLLQPAVSPVSHTIALIAESSQVPPRIITYTPEEPPTPTTLNPEAPTLHIAVSEPASGEIIHRRSQSERLLPEHLAVPRSVEWVGHDGEMVYGLYYAPCNPDYESEGAPPLIVRVHGGPTGQAATSYKGDAQFFASRGCAVLEVNYRGSTGYGKAYMRKLYGNWGIYDVEDSASGVTHLAEQGLADPARAVIMGSSAGGFTVLQSLVTKPGFYKAGICMYGVANHIALVLETHKFEARYHDALLGPLPQAASLYKERSPLFNADKIVDPVAIFQGEDDRVVPRNQSDAIVASLRRRGVPHEYHVYADEGHGWRRPETIEAFYTTVLKFLWQYVVLS